MTARTPAHILLAERLDRVRNARHIVLHAPAGSGKTRILADIIARAAESGLVLVVSSRRELLAQWAMVLLRNHAATPLRDLDPDLALELASLSPTQPHHDHGVLLTTTANVRRGPVRLALQSLPLALFLLDGLPRPDSATLAAVIGIVDRARQTIVVDQNAQEDTPSWLQHPELVQLTLAEVIAMSSKSHVSPEDYVVTLGDGERAIFQQAATLLDKRHGIRSRPALHSALMQLISEGQVTSRDDQGRVKMAWSLVDSLEGLGPDPRLAAMTEAVLHRKQSGPVIVVTGPLRAEVEYVRDHLTAHGIRTTEWTMQDPPQALATAADRDPLPVIVATPSGLEVGESLLQDTTLVYFTRPRSDTDRAWLLSALHTGMARGAVLPVDEPPIASGS
ncbi:MULTISPECIES: DEAD/DEAH box helicase family protein [unclassified Micromonospora]|uniref:DEAD/DEAH box helicase family protein n=1 Tax=unclassified Micromonospora TaxID=2617518 RepID=UPI00146D459C|nr:MULTISPECIES: DEAD/DEAH box helicase family protein [unclassified Micromonospora]MBQ1022865.1 DEAD/DEAH box helicase family protein [Micromonospora sp. C95]NLU78193.1 DEAD/DEAH box helicase family protein [Micromonospora sp. HNM0581]